MRNLIFVAVCLCPSVRADPNDDARRHWQEGTVAYALGRFTAAAAEYEEAFIRRPVPELLYNAAQAHRFAGNKRRALMLYQSYLSTPLFSRRPMADHVERHIEVLRAALDREEQTQRTDLPPVRWPDAAGGRPRAPKPRAAPATDQRSELGPALAGAALPAMVVVALLRRRQRRVQLLPPSTVTLAPSRVTLPLPEPPARVTRCERRSRA